MTLTPLYLDYAASAPLRPEALAAMVRVAEAGGNASSVHALGRRARLIVEEARAEVLKAVGCIGGQAIFTSGGTEANALALHQAALDVRSTTLIVGDGEHDSLYAAAGSVGKPVIHASLLSTGDIHIDALSECLKTAGSGAHVFIQLANNETGVINDIRAVAEAVHTHGGRLHVDAVQALGKIRIDFNDLGADTLSLAAHKIGGPQGVGALIVRREVVIKPLILGGGQEMGQRAGTENVAGIAGFAAALSVMAPVSKALEAAQARVEAQLVAQGVEIMGQGVRRVPGLLSMAQTHWASPLQLIHMDMAGICVSSGSACSSGKVKPSRVLSAMGHAALAGHVLRVSSGWRSAPEDWDIFYDVWSEGYETYLKRHVNRGALKESV